MEAQGPQKATPMRIGASHAAQTGGATSAKAYSVLARTIAVSMVAPSASRGRRLRKNALLQRGLGSRGDVALGEERQVRSRNSSAVMAKSAWSSQRPAICKYRSA